MIQVAFRADATQGRHDHRFGAPAAVSGRQSTSLAIMVEGWDLARFMIIA
jgi:hypothetical protein